MTITPGQLERRYHYMFAGPNIGISSPRGWMSIFEQLCKEIDFALGTDKRNFHFTQCKEKFGAARWYWSMELGSRSNSDTVTHDEGMKFSSRGTAQVMPINRQIDELVQTATDTTNRACIACGESGGVTQNKGWWLVLCERHAREIRAGKQVDILFEEVDQ